MAGQPRRLIEVQHGAAAKKSHGNLGIVWNKNRTTMEGTKSDGILACKSLQSEPPDQNSYIYIYIISSVLFGFGMLIKFLFVFQTT